MAYTDDAVLAKLSALNETQESIVTVAQWVMFHRRHADRTGQLWLQRLKDSNSSKRLNLIYLANEVAQQSKARRKDDFLIAFSPVIAEATATAYKGATNEIQQKLKRVVEVWRQRQIFELPIQDAIESRIEELDKNRSTGKRGFNDGSLFSKGTGSVPSELTSVVSELQTITKLALSTRTSLNAANQEYDKITDANAATPSAPVHAARLNGLLKTLANAEGAVTESMKARKLLIRDLEAFLKTHVDELAKEEAQIQQLSERRTAIDAKKKDVEDTIMRGFANNSNPGSPTLDNSPGQGHSQSPMTPAPEPDRPEVEALTPPTQSPRSPQTKHEHIAKIEDIKVPEPLFSGHAPSHAPAPPPPTPATAGLDLLASLSAGSYSQQTNSDGGVMKKRKISSTVADDFPDLGGDAMDGLDDDVKDMLRGN